MKLNQKLLQNKTISTNNFAETQKAGENFALRLNLDQGLTLNNAVVICLYGVLGAGKTTFLQGLAKGLGITQRIISPTFIIVRTYVISDKQKVISKLYHIDLYRTETIADLRSVGLDEILQDKNAVVAIEWAEKLGDLLPKKRIEIHFEYVDENTRKITFCHPGKRSASRISSEEILDKPE